MAYGSCGASPIQFFAASITKFTEVLLATLSFNFKRKDLGNFVSCFKMNCAPMNLPEVHFSLKEGVPSPCACLLESKIPYLNYFISLDGWYYCIDKV